MPQLFKIIASKINCTMEIRRSRDGLFGARHNNGSWSGIIGEIERGELDFSITDLSVTSERAKVVTLS